MFRLLTQDKFLNLKSTAWCCLKFLSLFTFIEPAHVCVGGVYIVMCVGLRGYVLYSLVVVSSNIFTRLGMEKVHSTIFFFKLRGQNLLFRMMGFNTVKFSFLHLVFLSQKEKQKCLIYISQKIILPCRYIQFFFFVSILPRRLQARASLLLLLPTSYL